MNIITILLIFARMLLFTIAGLMAFHDKSGWGWFFAAGILGNVRLPEKDEKPSKENEPVKEEQKIKDFK